MGDWVLACPDRPRWQAFIEARLEVAWNGCWIWTGATDRYGYGSFRVRHGNGQRVAMAAHRACWLALVGQLKPGLVVDHLCRNRRCCNPDHLEPVTNAENGRRGAWGGTTFGYPLGREHAGKGDTFPCGHPRDEQNTYVRIIRASGYTHRSCRTCNRARRARWAAAHAA